MTVDRSAAYFWFVVRAVLMLVALACAQLGPFVHALTAEHETCAEHGELIEVAESRAHEAPDAARAPEGPAYAPAVSLSGEEHAHDHCVLATHGTQTAETPLSSWTGTSTEHSPAVIPAIFVFADRAILELAPKTSPPVV